MTADIHWFGCLLTAALGNLPLAVIMITGTLRITRLTAVRLRLVDPTTPRWGVPLMP